MKSGAVRALAILLLAATPFIAMPMSAAAQERPAGQVRASMTSPDVPNASVDFIVDGQRAGLWFRTGRYASFDLRGDLPRLLAGHGRYEPLWPR